MTNSITNMIATKHLRIFGHVHGVGFRAWADFTAKNMNLTGWVRNVSKDSSVEIVVTGIEEDIEKFVLAAHKGPVSAKVEEVGVNDGFDEELKDFEIRETL